MNEIEQTINNGQCYCALSPFHPPFFLITLRFTFSVNGFVDSVMPDAAQDDEHRKVTARKV